MKSQKELIEIIDIRQLPNKVYVNLDWELSILLSDFDYVTNEGYLPYVFWDSLQGTNGAIEGVISDLDITPEAPIWLRLYDSDTIEFCSPNIDKYIEQTGAHNVLISLKSLNSYVLGLDREFVLIISKKNSGLISLLGGVTKLQQIFRAQIEKGSPAISKESLIQLYNAVYVNLEGMNL